MTPTSPDDPPEPYRSQYAATPYDGEIAYVDALVGEILDSLVRNGLYNNSLIVFAADHGESLGDHQEPQHGFFVYDSVLKVPLVIKLPAGTSQGKTVDAQVQTVDIMPTILQYLSIPKPKEVQGVSLRSLIEGKTSSNVSEPYAYSESYYAFSSFGWSPLRSLRTNKYKYIQAPQPELYDLEKDPLELNNLYAHQEANASRFKEDLQQFEQHYSAPSPAKQQLDREATETLKSLKSLGDVASATGFHTDTSIDYDRLSDPKDKIGLFKLYLEYVETESSLEGGQQKIAIELLQRLVKSDPNVNIAVDALTNKYLLANRYKDALSLNKTVLSANPKSETAAFNLGRIYSKLKRTGEAIGAYHRALDLNPRKAATHHNLGIAYIEKNAYSEAIKQLQQTIELEPGLTDPYVNLGLAYLLNQNIEQAIESWENAIQIQPEHALAHGVLGRIYIRIGKTAKGEAHLHLAKELKRKQETLTPP